MTMGTTPCLSSGPNGQSAECVVGDCPGHLSLWKIRSVCSMIRGPVSNVGTVPYGLASASTCDRRTGGRPAQPPELGAHLRPPACHRRTARVPTGPDAATDIRAGMRCQAYLSCAYEFTPSIRSIDRRPPDSPVQDHDQQAFSVFSRFYSPFMPVNRRNAA